MAEEGAMAQEDARGAVKRPAAEDEDDEEHPPELETGIPDKRSRIYALEIFRFLAAAHIIAYNLFEPKEGGVAKRFVSWGNVNVSFFFVLSGFVLTVKYLPQRKTYHTPTFFVRRFARVYPAYLVSLILLVYWNPKAYVSTGEKLGYFLLHALAAQSWYSPAFARYEMNVPAWAVSTIIFLYLLFPALLKLLGANFKTRSSKLAVAILMWPFTWMLYKVLEQIDGFPFNSSFPLLHVPAFWMGMCAGSLFVIDRPEYSGVWQFMYRLGGTLSVAAMVAVFLFVEQRKSWEWLVETGIAAPLQALAVYWVACGGDLLSWIFGWRPSDWLGQLSYGMFLFHVPVDFFCQTAKHRDPEFFVGILALVVLTLYVLVELPAAEWIVKTYTAKKAEL